MKLIEIETKKNRSITVIVSRMAQDEVRTQNTKLNKKFPDLLICSFPKKHNN
jgi:hypothetical protein